jgi:hypothetical protein
MLRNVINWIPGRSLRVCSECGSKLAPIALRTNHVTLSVSKWATFLFPTLTQEFQLPSLQLCSSLRPRVAVQVLAGVFVVVLMVSWMAY